jgi:hypothetical protein
MDFLFNTTFNRKSRIVTNFSVVYKMQLFKTNKNENVQIQDKIKTAFNRVDMKGFTPRWK